MTNLKPDEGFVETDEISKLKAAYLSYYAECPIQRYAAAYVGRNEDTIISWRASDSEFSEQVEAARALFVRKKLKQSPATWVLERLENQIFGIKDPRYDPAVQQLQQFNFIFNLDADGLRSFIQSGIARASVTNDGDRSSETQQVVEGETA